MACLQTARGSRSRPRAATYAAVRSSSHGCGRTLHSRFDSPKRVSPAPNMSHSWTPIGLTDHDRLGGTTSSSSDALRTQLTGRTSAS
eukprot:2416260-Rhodomonas_salina.1